MGSVSNQPFAAILIAHGTHVFCGGLLRPKGLKFKAACRDRGGVLGERGQLAPFPPLGSVGERCKLPQRSPYGGRKCRGCSVFFTEQSGGPAESMDTTG